MAMKRLTAFFMALFAMTASMAQNQDSDREAFTQAEWEITDLGKGAQAMYAQIDMFNSTQSISIVKYPAKKFRTEILHRPGESAGKPSEIGKEENAAFVLNGGYFHVKQRIPSVYFRKGKEVLSHTHPTELFRVDALLGFKDRKGRKARIEAVTDTTLYSAADRRWHSSLASGPLLILDGDIVVQKTMNDTTTQFYDKRHPRAAFGTDEEGFHYLVVIDGRFKGEADGTSIYETACICEYIGMTEAINLDGGGSTTLWTEKTGVINHPHDNRKFDHEGERTVPNMIAVY